MNLTLRFDSCFSRKKLRALAPLLPNTYAAMNELCPWRRGKWPTRVHCMDPDRVIEGRKRGAGHGYTYVPGDGVWMNPHMTPGGLWLVLIHENLHHGYPDATEDELNCVLLPWVYREVAGRKLDRAVARKHGIGPPEPGIGDRGYLFDCESCRF